MTILILIISSMCLVSTVFLTFVNLKYIEYFDEILEMLDRQTDKSDSETELSDIDKSGKELIERLNNFQKMKFSTLSGPQREQK
jgi:hypothetical protein